MPDLDPRLDDRLTGLRTDLRNAVPVPNPDTIVERSRQRRARRRMQAGAVAAVLAVSGLIPVLRLADSPPSPGSAPDTTTTAEFTDPPSVVDVQFAGDHGYALRAVCPRSTDDNPGGQCRLTLLAATDLENWTEVGPIPVPDPSHLGVSTLGELIVLGPDELVVDWGVTGEISGANPYRVRSDNGGRDWAEVTVPAEVTDVVPAIPSGGQLHWTCGRGQDREQRCDTTKIDVVLPGSGGSAVLATSPPLADLWPGTLPTAGNHWWAYGREPGTRSWAIAVSTDEGRTWTTTALGVEAEDASIRVASQGETLYASANLTIRPGVVDQIYRSDDGGRTWQRTWEQGEDQDSIQFVDTPVAGVDGALRLQGNETIYTFTDGGRTFSEEPNDRLGWIRWTRAGYVAVDVDRFELSTDGVHWRGYEFPEPE